MANAAFGLGSFLEGLYSGMDAGARRRESAASADREERRFQMQADQMAYQRERDANADKIAADQTAYQRQRDEQTLQRQIQLDDLNRRQTEQALSIQRSNADAVQAQRAREDAMRAEIGGIMSGTTQGTPSVSSALAAQSAPSVPRADPGFLVSPDTSAIRSAPRTEGDLVDPPQGIQIRTTPGDLVNPPQGAQIRTTPGDLVDPTAPAAAVTGVAQTAQQTSWTPEQHTRALTGVQSMFDDRLVRLYDVYARNGEMDKAQKVLEMADSQRGRAVSSLAAQALTAAGTRNYEGLLDASAQLYNLPGFVDDGIDVVRDRSSVVRSADGTPIGLRVTFKNTQTGAEYAQEFSDLGAFANTVVGFAMPDKVIERALKSNDVPRFLSPEQLQAVGLSSGTVAQMDPNGKVSVLQAPKPLPNETVKELSTVGRHVSDMDRFLGQYREGFGGAGIDALGQIRNAYGRNLASSGEFAADRAAWWQDYQAYVNVVRNELFGSALTSQEAVQFDRASINPGMTDAAIQRNLAAQQRAVRSAARRTAGYYTESGVSPQALEAVFGFPLSALNTPDTQDPNAQRAAGATSAPASTDRTPPRADAKWSDRYGGWFVQDAQGKWFKVERNDMAQRLVPVDFDPFASADPVAPATGSRPMKLVPVDFDPFAEPASGGARAAELIGAGLNNVIATIVGAPAGLAQEAVNLVASGINRVTGSDLPTDTTSPLGPSGIRRGMEAIGIHTGDTVKPEGLGESLLMNTAEAVGGGVLTRSLASLAAGSRAMQAAGPLSRSIVNGMAATSPGQFAAGAAMDAASAAGGTFAQALGGDAAEPYGSLIGGVVPAVGAHLAGRAIRTATDFMRPAYNPEQEAANRLWNSASDPSLVRNRLDLAQQQNAARNADLSGSAYAPDPGERIPGARPTTAQATIRPSLSQPRDPAETIMRGDTGLADLEAQMRNTNPGPLMDADAERSLAVQRAFEDTAKGIGGARGPSDLSSELWRTRTEQTAQDSAESARRIAAAEAATSEVGRPFGTYAEAGQAIRQPIQESFDRLKADEAAKWNTFNNAIPGDARIDMKNSRAAQDRIASERTNQSQPISGDEARITQAFNSAMDEGPTFTWKQAEDRARWLKDAMRSELVTNGATTSYRRMAIMLDATEKDIDSLRNTYTDLFKSRDIAREATRSNSALRERPGMDSLMTRSTKTGPYKLADEHVPNPFTAGGKTGAAALGEIDALLAREKAIGTAPEGPSPIMQQIERFAVKDFTDSAVKNGIVDTKAAERWLNSRRELLDRFPDLRDRIKTAKDAVDFSDQFAKESKDRAREWDRSLLRSFLGEHSDAGVQSLLDRVFASADAPAKVRELVAKAGNSKPAKDALKIALFEKMYRDTFTSQNIGVTGAKVTNSKKLADMLERRRDLMKEVGVSREEIRKLKTILQTLQRSEVKGKAPSAAAASPYGDVIREMNRSGLNTEANILRAISVGGTTSVASLLYGAGLSANMIAAVAGVGMAEGIRRMRATGLGDVKRIMEEAILDPERARLLLHKVPLDVQQGGTRVGLRNSKEITKAQNELAKRLERVFLRGTLAPAILSSGPSGEN